MTPVPIVDPGDRWRVALLAAGVGTFRIEFPSETTDWDATLWHLAGRVPREAITLGASLRVIAAEDRDRVADGVRACAERGSTFHDVFRLVRPGGSICWVEAWAVALRDAIDGTATVIGAGFDVTEQRRHEHEVRALDEFLALLAHELRNPLAPIGNWLHVLERTPNDAAAVDEARMAIAGQVEHIVRLLDELLDVARMKRNKIVLRRTELDLREAVDAAAEMTRPAIVARGLEFRVVLPRDPIPLRADRTRLVQVLSNLLTNAAKFTDHGVVKIGADGEDGFAIVRVRDTGIGIPAEKLETIFCLFAQVDSGLDRVNGGLGVGLSLARRLAELHGGTITASSAGLGRGSEFVLRLPLSTRPATRSLPGRQTLPGSRRRRTIGHTRVLVVDDYVASARSLSRLLRLLGHEVLIAHDGATAIATARAERPSVVFLDIGMPQMDGYEVARQLRAEPELAGIRLVALTGYGTRSDRERARRAGFDEHLVKPAGIEALERVLRNHVRVAHM